MNILLIGGLALLLAAPINTEHNWPEHKWIDLTHDFSAETIYWPTEKPFNLEVLSHGIGAGGYFYAANRFSAAEHGGTHIDAPIHFAEGQHSVEQIPLWRLIGPAVLIDVTNGEAANMPVDADYQISVADFENWEKQYGRLPDNSIILLRTGFGRYWPDKQKYLGTTMRGQAGVAQLHFPGLHPAAARWLVRHRQIASIGIDTPSIDYGQSTQYESHQILFAEQIPVFENLANLEKLPATGLAVIALPMKIRGGSGAPLRIIASTNHQRRMGKE